MTQRIMLAFGTRPEAIKMAAVYMALRALPEAFETLCCVTGQHRDMLDQVLDTFTIDPDFDLAIMRAGQNLTDLTAAVLTAMRPVLLEAKPDLVLVHGDTTTTMATSLAAFYAGIPVGHVEAGLRSGDLQTPFPEEFNRRATDMIAQYHFAPTELAKTNLLNEGIGAGAILVTGNTVVDAAQFVARRIDRDSAMRQRVEACLDQAFEFDWRHSRYVIVTCHRRETVMNCVADVCAALDRIAVAFPDIHFVFPVHPNPALRTQVGGLLQGKANLHLIEPLPYDAFLHSLRSCYGILTDSGGLQEEALALGKPVLIMRDVTERPEAITAGGARLVGTGCAAIVAGMTELLTHEQVYARMAAASNPFGDGKAAERIAEFLAAKEVARWAEDRSFHLARA